MYDKTIDFENFTERHVTLAKEYFEHKNIEEFLSILFNQEFLIAKIVLFGGWKDREMETLKTKYPTLLLSDGKNFDKSAYIYSLRPFKKTDNFSSEYVKDENSHILGSYFRFGEIEFLFKNSSGTPFERKNFKEQLVAEYELVDRQIKKYNFSWKNIFRFWNYMENVIQSYETFNKVRNIFFEKNEIKIYPAATGIQANLFENEVFIGFDAVKSEVVKLSKIFSDKQIEASEYGPKFSRGMSLSFPCNKKKVYVSGTSTIGHTAESLFQNDLYANVRYVLDSVKHILEKENMNFKNIVQSVIYVKNKEIRSVFSQEYLEQKLNFPFVVLEVPICRDTFLFEMECLAVK